MGERGMHDLGQKGADFEQHRQEFENQLERQREVHERQSTEHGEKVQELEQQVKEQQDKFEELDRQAREIQKTTHNDKENRVLKQTVQDQKNMLFDLESQLHREKTVATFLNPGEHVELVKKQENESFAHENAQCKMKLFGLETDNRQLRFHNDLLRKHLPRQAQVAVCKEMHAQPLPPNVQEPVAA